jgi:hypothetical protein
VAFQARDYTAALDHASQAIVLDPELWIGQMMRGQTYEQSAAFEWLDRALEVHDVHLVYLTVDPKWDDYRGDPRFDALLKRCRFAADASAPAAP